MAPTMEQLGRLKVNAGKSKVIVGSNGGKIIVQSESGPVVSVKKE